MKGRKIKNQDLRKTLREFKRLRRKYGTKCRLGDSRFCYAQAFKEAFERRNGLSTYLEQGFCSACYAGKYSKLVTKRFKYKFLRNKRCWRGSIINDWDD